jgi:hypothetical protein
MNPIYRNNAIYKTEIKGVNMNEYGQVEENYIVWVGGMEVGSYDCEADAENIASEWKDEGYDDVKIEEKV